MRERDKKTIHVRVTPAELESVNRAARAALQSANNYCIQSLMERMRREGKKWPERK